MKDYLTKTIKERYEGANIILYDESKDRAYLHFGVDGEIYLAEVSKYAKYVKYYKLQDVRREVQYK